MPGGAVLCSAGGRFRKVCISALAFENTAPRCIGKAEFFLFPENSLLYNMTGAAICYLMNNFSKTGNTIF